MKTAVEAIFIGEDRLYNRRFLQMGSHYLIEPVACTPASQLGGLIRIFGWWDRDSGRVHKRLTNPLVAARGLESLRGR